ncbi:unnamed protein product [Closterium sp. Yama58-4]|nr:unnamed protein product [Closterium sp. Yama58-4]
MSSSRNSRSGVAWAAVSVLALCISVDSVRGIPAWRKILREIALPESAAASSPSLKVRVLPDLPDLLAVVRMLEVRWLGRRGLERVVLVAVVEEEVEEGVCRSWEGSRRLAVRCCAVEWSMPKMEVARENSSSIIVRS